MNHFGFRRVAYIFRAWILSTGIIFALISAGGCRRTEAHTTVKIGYLPIYVDLPLFVAKEQGFFQKRGVNVDLVRFAASPEIGTALSTHGIDMGASIAFAVVLSNESRDPGKLKIFIVDSENRTNYLSSFVTLPSSGIKTVHNLKGKTLGVFPGPTASTFCRLILEKYGLQPNTDLKVVELQAGSHIPALQSHTVDALFTYEPISTQAVMELGAVKFLPGAVESEIMSPWQAGVWVTSTDFAKAHPSENAAVIAALYDAIDFIERDPNSAKTSLAEYTSIKPNIAEKTPNIPFAKRSTADMGALQKQADILRSQGIVSKTVDVRTLLVPENWTRP